MPFKKTSNAPKVIVGSKQVIKAIISGNAKEVLVALDAEKRITGPVVNHAMKNNVRVVYINTMKELGRNCNIDVGAATAVIENKLSSS